MSKLTSTTYFFILMSLSMLFIACMGAKKANEKKMECNTIVTVKDMRNLDGCTALLITEEGKKLLPSVLDENIPQDFNFVDGQKLSISYDVVNDMVSICMAEDHIVKINCLTIMASDRPAKLECFNTISPLEVPWMKRIMTGQKPREIIKYRYLDAWAYEFISEQNQSLYDCQGNLLAQNKNGDDDYTKRKKMLTNAQSIWILNN